MQDLEEQTQHAAATPENVPEPAQDTQAAARSEPQTVGGTDGSEALPDAVEQPDSAHEHASREQTSDATSASGNDGPEDSNAADESLETRHGVDEDGSDVSDVYIAEAVADGAPSEDARNTLKAIIEAAIYITDEPLTIEQIAAAIEQPVHIVKDVLAQLVREYAQADRGLTVRELAGGYKMGTKPEIHESIRAFVKRLQPPLKLSLAALETLAVVAYKQPITAPEIMEIRGVQGAGVLKTLLDRKLIATAGRKDVIGKPIMYKTTKEFLIQFGLSSLNELPTLKEFEELGRLALTDESPQEPEGPSTPEQAEALNAARAKIEETAGGGSEPVERTSEPAANDLIDSSQQTPEADSEPATDESRPFEDSVGSGKSSDA